jgi:hypothetical protein
VGVIGRIWSGLKSLLPMALAGEPAPAQPQTGDLLMAGPWGGEISGRINEIIGEFDPHRVTTERMLQMRNDPAVAFATALVRAPIINLNWRVDSLDPKIAASVDAALRPRMRSLLKALSNAQPFGFKVVEKVYQVGPLSYDVEGENGKPKTETLPLAWTFKRFKPIDSRTLTLLADEVSGEFLGVRQSGTGTKDRTADARQLVLWSFRDEDVDGNLKGFPLYFQMYSPWHSKQRNKFSRDVYLERNATPIPIGRAVVDPIRDDKGNLKDGYAHMRSVMRARAANGEVILPSKRDEKSGHYLFDIEYRENTGKAADVYQVAIDKDNVEIMHAAGITDEVATSQEMGGRARSETHADTFSEMSQAAIDEVVDEVLNPQVVDEYVLLNHGEQALRESKTRLVSGGIARSVIDAQREILKAVMDAQAMHQADGKFIPLWKRIDAVAICKTLDVPLLAEDEVEPDPAPEEPPAEDEGVKITDEMEREVAKELARRGITEE